MNKRHALLICIIMAVMTVATVAFARYEPCPRCENGRFVLVETSKQYNKSTVTRKCRTNPGKIDTVNIYYVDELWACSNSNCPEYYVDTIKHEDVIHSHD